MDFNATFIVAFVSFIIFCVIMNKILYQPISDIVEKRNKFIDENYNEAKENSEKSKSILKDRLNQLREANDTAKTKFTKAMESAKDKKNQRLMSAKEQSKVDIKEKTIDFQKQSDEAKNALKGEIVSLAQMISDKFIQSDLKVQDENELIEKIMQG